MFNFVLKPTNFKITNRQRISLHVYLLFFYQFFALCTKTHRRREIEISMTCLFFNYCILVNKG